MAKGKIFYGWKIVTASVVCLALMWTLPITGFSLFFKPITADLGFERASLALCSSILLITSMLMSPLVGHWIDAYSVKLVVGVSVVGVAAGFVGYSISSSLLSFYIFAFVIGVSLNGASIMAFSIIIKNWFVKKQGLAISIALAGTGVGGVIMSPVINWLIQGFGWRFAYRVLACLILVVVLPIVFFFIRKRPQEMGLEPYGAGSYGDDKLGVGARCSITLRELKRLPVFWTFMFGIAATGFAGSGVLLQGPAYMSDLLGPDKAALAVSAYLGILIAGKMILGEVFDAHGSKAGILYGYSTMTLAIVALSNVKIFACYIAFIILHGLGSCAGTITPPVLTGRLFGSKNYGKIYGVANLSLDAGMALGGPATALIFDVTGSYATAWYVCTAVSAASMLCLLWSVDAVKKIGEKEG